MHIWRLLFTSVTYVSTLESLKKLSLGPAYKLKITQDETNHDDEIAWPYTNSSVLFNPYCQEY